MKQVIAICGGIGSGKSVVSTILRLMGYPVYDCDSRAKKFMDHSDEIKHRLQLSFGQNVIDNGNINRILLGQIVFSDKKKLLALNAIVHPAVRADFQCWVNSQKTAIVFVETAILKESGMSGNVNAIWMVSAPTELRIYRVMKRNNLLREAVEKRIAVQKNSNVEYTDEIMNDEQHSVLFQIDALLRKYGNRRRG